MRDTGKRTKSAGVFRGREGQNLVEGRSLGAGRLIMGIWWLWCILATRHDFIRIWSRFWLFLTGGGISEPPLRALALPGNAQCVPLATDVHICNVHIAHVVFQHAGQKQYRPLVVSSCILESDLSGQLSASRAVGLSFGSERFSQAFKPTASPLWKETTRGAAPHERFCVQSGVGWRRTLVVVIPNVIHHSRVYSGRIATLVVLVITPYEHVQAPCRCVTKRF